jgi:hypothetical protein
MPDLTTTAVDDLVTVAENRINDELWVRERETALAVSVSGSSVPIPSDYESMKHAYLDSAPIIPLQKKSAEWIYQNYIYRSESGRPAFYAEENDTFIFGPIPDSTYTMKGVYYKTFTSMAASGTTNALFSAYPEIYLFAALSEASPFIGQDQRQVWEMKYQQAVSRAVSKDKKRLFSGSPLAVTVA